MVRKKVMMYRLAFVVVVLLVGSVSLTLGKQVVAKKTPAAPSINNITQAAVQSGVLACTSRIEQVSNFITKDGKSGVFLFTPPSEPDQRMFSASLEITHPNSTKAYASLSFAPNQANGCGALYETVTYSAATCKDVLAKDYSGLKPIGKLGEQTLILDIGSTSRIFLMPADKGCITIKKEVLL